VQAEAQRADQPGEQDVNLPSLLDLAAADPLCRALRERLLAAVPIHVTGSRVERVSTSCIQVLLAAAADARAHRLAFRLRDPSPALADALADLGVTPELSLSRRAV
jgi:anti-anti-sigma regulatory factor